MLQSTHACRITNQNVHHYAHVTLKGMPTSHHHARAWPSHCGVPPAARFCCKQVLLLCDEQTAAAGKDEQQTPVQNPHRLMLTSAAVFLRAGMCGQVWLILYN